MGTTAQDIAVDVAHRHYKAARQLFLERGLSDRQNMRAFRKLNRAVTRAVKQLEPSDFELILEAIPPELEEYVPPTKAEYYVMIDGFEGYRLAIAVHCSLARRAVFMEMQKLYDQMASHLPAKV